MNNKVVLLVQIVKDNLKIMNGIKLPIRADYLTRPSYATLFVKIGENDGLLKYAICHTLTNIYFEESYLEIVDHYTNYVLRDLFDTNHRSFYRQKIIESKNEIIIFLQEKLTNNYYITCYLDDYFIKGSSHYNIQHFCNEHLVYGFDRVDSVFDVISFNDNGFIDNKISFDLFFSSLYIFPDDLVPFSYSKLKCDNDYSFNKHFIRQNISDYVESKNRFWVLDNSKKTFGLKALQSFYKYFNYLIDNRLPISTNDCLLLLDHKRMFAKRLEYLEESAIITSDHWAEIYTPVLQMARKQVDFCQEYNNNGFKSNCRIPYSEDLILTEEHILNKLIKTGF